MFQNQNAFEVAIYFVESGYNKNKYHLYLENTKNPKETTFIASATSAEELYEKAFQISDEANRSNIVAFAMNKINEIKQREELSLGVGKGYLHRGNQEKARFHFLRANSFFQQRTIIENELVGLLGINY